MKNDALQIATPGTMQMIPTEDIAGHVEAIRQIQAKVMIKDKHYGKIKGCGPKPTLFKSGAELVLMTFQIHLSDIEVEDLSGDDEIRYRIKCFGATPDGIVRGIGIGEASSSEGKYKWRKAVNNPEFEATPASRRREKHGRDWKKKRDYTTKQVRTNPADSANTILKMAKKRAYVDLALTATAASDVFSQDVEDQPSCAHKSEDRPRSQGSGAQSPAADLTGGFVDGAPSANMAVGPVDSVEVFREGANDGDPWTLYSITVGGEQHKTFDDTIAERAKAAQADGRPVEIGFKLGKHGRDIVDLGFAAAAKRSASGPAEDKPAPTGNAARINAAQEEYALSDTAVDGMIADMGLPPSPDDWQAQDVARMVARMKAAKA